MSGWKMLLMMMLFDDLFKFKDLFLGFILTINGENILKIIISMCAVDIKNVPIDKWRELHNLWCDLLKKINLT